MRYIPNIYYTLIKEVFIMIITFDLRNCPHSRGEQFIVDNCVDLRIQNLDSQKKLDEAMINSEMLALMQGYVVKNWWNVEILSEENMEEELFDPTNNLLEFESNNKRYYVISGYTVYIANDQNKTIKVLN